MNFRDTVFQIVSAIPRGKVLSYGAVAALAGRPRAARQVGWMLAGLPEGSGVPWWRVVNSKGYLSIRGEDLDVKEIQKQLLENEGVEVNDQYELDIKKYSGWDETKRF